MSALARAARRSHPALTVLAAAALVVVVPPAGERAAGEHPESAPALQMVALGDSYSSGEGNPPFDSGTSELENACHRSARAWPRLLGVSPTRHLACSRVGVDALLEPQAMSGPDAAAQLARLRGIAAVERVDVVTLSVGGNDVGFGPILALCVAQVTGDCLRDSTATRAKVATLVAELRDVVLPDTRASAPGARVVLVGYPALFPRHYRDVHGCTWLRRPEHAAVLALQAELNAGQRATARAAGVDFVDTTTALAGHELCSGDPWYRPVVLTCGVPRLLLEAASFCAHPWEQGHRHGQRAIADRVARRLARLLPGSGFAAT